MPDRGSSDPIDQLGETIASSDIRPGSARGGESAGAGLEATVSVSASAQGVSPLSTDLVLRPFGPYTRVELLAQQGAMGIVAKGFNEAFRRWELLKFLRTDQSDTDLRERQFLREGRVLARLSHPNVVQVFAIYQVDGRPCLAMEYLQGASLTAHVAESEGRLPVSRWYELFLDAARGLAAAHEVGLLHRDLKPDNLFVVRDDKGRSGGLKLIDFGLATAARARREGENRDSGLVADLSGGTPVYMAPELWGNAEGTPTSDVFGLGMSFYYAAAGRLPFEAAMLAHVIRLVTSPEPFVSVRQFRPDLPAPLADVMARAIAKDPDKRFANAEDLLAALVAAGEASRPRRVPGSGPYRGLAPYTTNERDVFFGRDVETAEVLERLRTRAGVMIVGPDGVGKTSFLQAALVPAVEAGALGFGLDYRAVRVEPAVRPLQALAAAMASATGTPEKQILSFLHRTPERMAEALRESAEEHRGFIVVADPLEALLAEDADYAEVLSFCRALASIGEVPRPELRLLATVRADRIDRLFAIESLRPLLNHGFYPLRPLAGAELRKALQEPARTAGFEFETPAILDEIVAEAGRTSAGLPLASFAMSAWWTARDQERRILREDAWRRLGGLQGALVTHAESVVSSMGRDNLAATEVLIGRLVSSEGDRQRVNRSDLEDPAFAGPDAPQALQLLLDARVVQESFGTVELAHDALVTSWPRVKAMRETAGEDWAFRERVAAAAHAWDSQGRPDGALWTGHQATRLVMWLSSTKATLTQTELAFAETVRRKSALRKLVVRSAGIAAALVLAAFAVAAKSNEVALRRQLAEAVEQRNQSNEAFLRSEAARLRLEAESSLPGDPRAALDSAIASYELRADPVLDNLSWRAHALGVPALLPRLDGSPTAVRFSPSGQWLVVADSAHAVHVLASMDVAWARAGGSAGQAVALAMSPEGQLLAVGRQDGSIQLGAAPGFALDKSVSCAGEVIDLVFSDERELLADCSPMAGVESVMRIDPSAMTATQVVSAKLVSKLRPSGFAALVGGAAVAIWSKGALSPALPLDLDHGDITALAMGAEPSALVVGTTDGSVLLAPPPGAPQGAAATVVSKHDAAITSVGLSPDGEAVVSFSGARRARLDLLKAKRALEWPTARELVSWIPARHAVVLSGADNDAVVISTQTGEELGRLHGAHRPLIALSSDPAGRWLVGASADGAWRAYALEEAITSVARASSFPAPEWCATSPDGSWAGCIGRDGAGLEQVLREGREALPARRMTLGLGGAVRGMALAAQGKRLVAYTDRDVFEDGRKLVVPGPAVAVAASLRADTIAAAGVEPFGWVRVLAAQQEPVRLDCRPSSVAVSPSGQMVLVGCDDGSLRKLDAAGRDAEAIRVEGGAQPGAVSAVAASDDGQMIAAATRRGMICIGPGDKANMSIAHQVDEPVACMAFARSSSLVWFVTQSGRMGFADAAGHGWYATDRLPSPATSCGRSPVDDRFVVVSADGSVRVRWFDLGPLAGARKPDPDTAGRRGPRVETWRGLPTERTW